MIDLWAQRVLCDRLCLSRGEHLLILIDDALRGVGEALRSAALRQGAGRTVLHVLSRARGSLALVPDQLLTNVAGADVIISLLSDLDLSREMPLLRAAISAFRRQNRGRWAFGAWLNEEILLQDLSTDYREVERIALERTARLARANQIELITEIGTEIRLKIGGRPIQIDTGLLSKPGSFGNIPAGEVFVAPIEESAEGSLVVDLCLGDITLDCPVTLTFRGGRVIDVQGGHAASELVRRLGSESWAWTVGELGLGSNPYLRISGRVTTDEKVLGTAHIALGANVQFGGKNVASTHYDCVIGAPRVYLDGTRM